MMSVYVFRLVFLKKESERYCNYKIPRVIKEFVLISLYTVRNGVD